MTIRAYILDKLKAYGVSESQLIDIAIASDLDLDGDVDAQNATSLGVVLTQTLEELILAPRMSNVSESGFSVSWNYDNVGKYYIWLCRKWGITPNDEVVSMLGISTIIDKTDIW